FEDHLPATSRRVDHGRLRGADATEARRAAGDPARGARPARSSDARTRLCAAIRVLVAAAACRHVSTLRSSLATHADRALRDRGDDIRCRICALPRPRLVPRAVLPVEPLHPGGEPRPRSARLVDAPPVAPLRRVTRRAGRWPAPAADVRERDDDEYPQRDSNPRYRRERP